MKKKITKIVLAGLAGGVALNVMMLITFRLIGFGWSGNGILLNPSLQSRKLIAVWTQIEPIPRVVSSPVPILIGLLLFGVVHAFIYQWLAPFWPAGVWARAWRMALLLFLLTFLFWEFFTPFNLFYEPIPLILLQLIFWAIIAAAEALAIAAVLDWKSYRGKRDSI